MNLLLPLGLLGLISLLILLLIYILKPNYQQKLISSTHVWKLSLKYARKRVPISKLRNILIILFQILTLTAVSLIMAYPAIVNEIEKQKTEKIVVIDASARMLAETDGNTRFDRAKEKTQQIIDDVFVQGGKISIILASSAPQVIVQRATVADWEEVNEKIAALSCTYGAADIDGALALTEPILNQNSEADIILCTATQYLTPSEAVTVEDVSLETEWNAAILNAKAELVENNYEFTVELATYGIDKDLNVALDVVGINGTEEKKTLPIKPVYCHGEETMKLVYSVRQKYSGENAVDIQLDSGIYSFEEVYIHMQEPDSYFYDNEFYLYGGKKPTVKVQYASTNPQTFFQTIFSNLRSDEHFMANWNIEITEVPVGSEPATEGFDFYVFEHQMPTELPQDGVVLMADPDRSAGAGFTISRRVTIPNWQGDGEELSPGVDHPILDWIDPTAFHLSEYVEINEDSLDSDYKVLMYYEGSPVFFLKDEPNSKIAVMAFNIHKSNLPLNPYTSVLMNNFFDYFLPPAFAENVYDVYDAVKINARAASATVTDAQNGQIVYDDLPTEITVGMPGTYSVSQMLLSGENLVQKFYVKIGSAQSNINNTELAFKAPYVQRQTEAEITDLLVYFAAALVFFLFAERLLYSVNKV